MKRQARSRPNKQPDPVVDQVIQRLSLSAVGMTTREVARSCRISVSASGGALRELQIAGQVKRAGTRWVAITRAGSPETPPPTTPTKKSNEPRRATRRKSLSRESRTSKSGRWFTFRRLCEYYAECVRLDQGTTIHGKANEEDEKFVVLNSLKGTRVDPRGWTVHSVKPSWGQFIRGLANQDFAFLGYPVHRYHWQDNRSDAQATYLSPVFVCPVEFQIEQMTLRLRPRGRLRINEGWLERRFKNVDQRRVFLQLCGFLERDETAAADDFITDLMQAAESLALYFPELCAESIASNRLTSDQPLHKLTVDGIYNRAVLLLPRKSKYVQRLNEELLSLAHDVPDEQLDQSSLSTVFTVRDSVGPLIESAPSHQSLISVSPLNSEQRDACKAAADSTLTVIFGPPGTGKSQTVASILTQAIIGGRAAVFASRNHQALEAVVPRLNAVTEPDVSILRLSYPWGAGPDDALMQSVEGLLARADDSDERDSLAIKQASLSDRLVDWCKQAMELEESVKEIFQARDDLYGAEDAMRLCFAKLPDGFAAKFRRPLDVPHAADIAALRGSLLEPQLTWSIVSIVRWIRYRIEATQTLRRAQQIDNSFRSYFIPNQPGMPLKKFRQARDFFSKAMAFWEPVARANESLRGEAQAKSRLMKAGNLEQQYDGIAEAHKSIHKLAANVLRVQARYGSDQLTVEERERLAEWLAAMRNKSGADNEADRQRLSRYQMKCISTLKKRVPIVATTNLSVGRDIPLAAGCLDLLILDEASQCDIASVVPLLFRSKQAVIVGDPNQLTHVTGVSAATDRQLRQQFGVADDKLERYSYRSTSAFQLCSTSPRLDRRVLLKQHYRCHPDIAEYCNQQFYRDQLMVLTSRTGCGLRWSDVEDDVVGAAGGGAISLTQINTVIHELERLASDGYSGAVGVVTPFRQQANRLRDKIWKVIGSETCRKWNMLVDTADGFQGDERDLVLFSLVGGVNLPDGSLRFLRGAPNRFNVAVSRAKQTLHVFCNGSWAKTCGIDHILKLHEACERATRAEGTLDRSSLIGPVWEPRFADALRARGIPFEQQHSACGRYLDFALIRDDLKLGVEIDGETYHRGEDGWRVSDDRERDMALVAAGWKVLRFWVYELQDDMPSCVDRVQRIWGKHRNDAV